MNRTLLLARSLSHRSQVLPLFGRQMIETVNYILLSPSWRHNLLLLHLLFAALQKPPRRPQLSTEGMSRSKP